MPVIATDLRRRSMRERVTTRLAHFQKKKKDRYRIYREPWGRGMRISCYDEILKVRLEEIIWADPHPLPHRRCVKFMTIPETVRVFTFHFPWKS